MRSNLPDKANFLGRSIPGHDNYVITEYIDSGSNGHLFRATNPSIEGDLAFKVVPTANLSVGDQQLYLEEAKKANILDNSAVVRYRDVVPYTDPISSTPCVVFVCDYVDGKSLQDYIDKREHRERVDLTFIRAFLSTMLSLLFELQARRLTHGDLHAGNVLVVTSPYDIEGLASFRVTDFGVRTISGSAGHATDFLNVANTLSSLLSVLDYSLLDGRDRFIYTRLRDDFLRRHLIETDHTADPLAMNPRGLLQELRALDQKYDGATADERALRQLTTPFDYPNCEQIGNSHLLLKALYSDRLLGLADVSRRSNVVLTGPRGCGKTTVFRALSLDYRIETGSAEPTAVDYIGIYYRCDDLYFAFPRYEEPTQLDAIDLPMHYLTASLLGRTLEDLEKWATRFFVDEWRAGIQALVADLWSLFDWQMPNDPAGRELSTLVHRLKGKERRRASKNARLFHRGSQPSFGYFGPDVLLTASKLLSDRFAFLANRPFYFFIDDFSRPKVTAALQANLNRLLMHRTPYAFFKISTESPVSFVRHDIDGKRFVESREFDFINLGLRYINDRSNQSMQFIDDLFSRRFQAVESYPVESLNDLLGSTPRNENATARVLRGEGTDEDKVHRLYAGKEAIAKMCSGDIHYIIRLVGRMVDDDLDGLLAASRGISPIIPPELQHNTIRASAGEFIDQLSRVPDRGPQLAKVVTAIGNVAHSYLRYRSSKNGPDRPPHQASRIEPFEPLDLSDRAKQILEDLLRYSVLIEDPRGKSRRWHVVPRFYLRRYLIPHFRLTFSQRDSIELNGREIERLLLDPDSFENRHRIRSPDRDEKTDDLLRDDGGQT